MPCAGLPSVVSNLAVPAAVATANVVAAFAAIVVVALVDRWGKSVRLYFGGLQNHCRW